MPTLTAAERMRRAWRKVDTTVDGWQERFFALLVEEIEEAEAEARREAVEQAAEEEEEEEEEGDA